MSSETLVERVLDEYLEELAAGGRPDREAWLRRYPELADTLRGVFRTLELVEATGRSRSAAGLGPGAVLGDFRIEREIARGGMGVVYEAVQVSLGRRVALKVLASAALLSPRALERFAREAGVAGRLHHTNIVPVYAVGESDGVHYYVMQLIEGGSLADVVRELAARGARPGRAHHRRVARWGRQVAEALACAHREGIVHRDVKPSNLLLDARDDVWLTDFGLARADAGATLTLSGDVVGSARTMSPEQARGDVAAVGPRSDVYSLGATLYELLALRPAFDGESRDEVLDRVVRDEPAPLRRVAPGTPRDLETVVARCLAKRPEDRYADAAALAEDCRRFLAREPIRARRPSVAVRLARLVARHRLHAAGALVALLLALATGGLWLRERRAAGARAVAQAFEALLHERDFAAAERFLDEAAARGADGRDALLCRALIPLLDDDPHGGLDRLAPLAARDPDDTEVALALALALTSTGDFWAGARALERVAADDVDTALGWLLHGLTLSRSQRTRAVESFDRAVALRSDFVPAIRARAAYRGVRLLVEGAADELEPMLADYDALVVFRPLSPRAHAERAGGRLCAAAWEATRPDGARAADGWLRASRADLARAVDLGGGDDEVVLEKRALLAFEGGDFAAAADAYARARAASARPPDRPSHLLAHRHALALWARGELDEARAVAEPALRAAPDYYSLAVGQALVLAELGRLDEARAVGRETLARQASNATALFIAAGLMELLGEPGEAAAALRALAARDLGEFTSEDAERAGVARTLAWLTGAAADEAALDRPGDLPGTRCEHAFLVALRRLAAGDRAGGRAALATCLDTGVYPFLEHRLARVLLARAAADPRWPAWVGER